MEPPGGRDSRFTLGGYGGMNLLSGGGDTPSDMYGRPSTSLQQLSPRHTLVSSACGGRSTGIKSDLYDDRGGDHQGLSSHQQTMAGLDSCGGGGVADINDDHYGAGMQSKKSPPSNGKKTKGRVKIKMEYIENKLRRYTTFSKRKTGIMKKAYELSTLTGTQVMLLVASETGHVYTFATRKLQPMITSEAGKALIQTCLNSPDPPVGSVSGGDQRMSATGFEETELTYNISDDDSKVRQMVYGGHGGHGGHGGSPHAHAHSAHSAAAAAGLAYAAHLQEQGHLAGLGGSPQHHGGYAQACPSPLPPPHQGGYGHPHSHMHSHAQR